MQFEVAPFFEKNKLLKNMTGSAPIRNNYGLIEVNDIKKTSSQLQTMIQTSQNDLL